MENAHHRKKEPELNKQLIIDAATDIGAEADWHHVTFQSIADRTGLSKGGIIHHFKNKEELLDELLSQSLSELTHWMENYKRGNPDQSGALAYLNFILTKKKDAKYRKTMRIVLQAIMINAKYKDQWEEWSNSNLMLGGEESDMLTESLIIFLIAYGIWYSESIGSKEYSEADKKRIMEFIKKMK